MIDLLDRCQAEAVHPKTGLIIQCHRPPGHGGLHGHFVGQGLLDHAWAQQ